MVRMPRCPAAMHTAFATITHCQVAASIKVLRHERQGRARHTFKGGTWGWASKFVAFHWLFVYPYTG